MFFFKIPVVTVFEGQISKQFLTSAFKQNLIAELYQKKSETTKWDAIKTYCFKTSLEGKDNLMIIINNTTSV